MWTVIYVYKVKPILIIVIYLLLIELGVYSSTHKYQPDMRVGLQQPPG